LNHPAEKILIFASEELRPKYFFCLGEDLSSEKEVSRPTLPPLDPRPTGVAGPLVKSTFDNPAGRRFIEMGNHRTEHPIDAVRAAGFEEGEEPVARGKFIIVNESHEVAARSPKRQVSSEGDVLTRLNDVRNRDPSGGREAIDGTFRGALVVVINDYYGIGKTTVRLLSGDAIKQAVQKLGSAIRANADSHMAQPPLLLVVNRHAT
jgi:hypothetical protein